MKIKNILKFYLIFTQSLSLLKYFFFKIVQLVPKEFFLCMFQSLNIKLINQKNNIIKTIDSNDETAMITQIFSER